MHEIHFRVPGVKRSPVNATAGRSPHNHRNGSSPSVMRFSHDIGQLIEATGDEIDELHFSHWTKPQIAHPARRSDDCGFADGRIDHPFVAEFCQQSLSRLERSAENSDIFAEHYHGWIALHFFGKRLA